MIVVAHPDDEYAFAATTYRLVRELGWTADQLVITNGEAGYRYSTLAEAVYGVALTDEIDGRSHLPAIRKQEALNAGKILGIRHVHFVDQRDSGFSSVAASAGTENWDRPHLSRFIGALLEREHYSAVLTLLPTQETHGHHRAATLLALEAVSRLPAERRPLVFGVEARSSRDASLRFSGAEGSSLANVTSAEPLFRFDRTAGFGFRNSLDYQIVVNWVIAEHKSQGLFQMDCGRHDLEEFWLFQISGTNAANRADDLRRLLLPSSPIHPTAHAYTGAK